LNGNESIVVDLTRRLIQFAAAMCVSTAALAASGFEIPAGDLKPALDSFARQSGLQLIYRTDDVAGLSTRGIAGELSREQALQTLLQGTGLTLKLDGDRSAVIFPADPSPASLQKVLITGANLHLADANRTATRSDASPMDLPLSISTVSREAIVQQNNSSIADAVSTVAGVAVPGTSGALTIRGFAAGMLKNGTLNAPKEGLTFSAPPIAISSIEVVRGPEAIVAGQGAGYGGVVNVITKAPQIARTREVALSVSDDGQREVGADFGGALSDDNRFTGRVILADMSQRADALGYQGDRRMYVAPSFGFKNPSSGTGVVLSYERNEQSVKNWWQTFYNEATQSLDSRLKPVRLGSNTEVLAKGVEENLALKVTQQLNEHWRLDANVLRSTIDVILPGGRVGLIPPGAYPTVFGVDAKARSWARKRSAKLDLNGELEVGNATHRLLLAYDTEATDLLFSSAFARGTYNASTGDVISPPRSTPWSVVQDATPKESGVLLMDHVAMGRWTGIFGVRRVTYAPGDNLATEDESFAATLPSVGLVYRVTPDVSLYANRSRGFQGNTGAINFATKRQVEPGRATLIELGVKGRFASPALAASAALFEIDERNKAVIDVSNPGYFVSARGALSKGLDVELSGKLSDHLGVRFAYAYLNVDVPPDQRKSPYARHQYSASLAYSFDGTAAGWWIGGGATGRASASSGEISLAGAEIFSPSSIRIDLNGGYSTKQWSVVMGVKNISDRMNYTLESGYYGTGFLEQGRRVYLTGNYLL
jgi:iron complex outermembrane receptor protein